MTAFDWKLHPQAEKTLLQIVSDFLENNDAARRISEKMQMETATQFFDWIDHVALPADQVDVDNLVELGFLEKTKVAKEKHTQVYTHTASILFPIILTNSEETTLALKPENLDYFLQMNHFYYNWSKGTGKLDQSARNLTNIEGDKDPTEKH